MRIGSKASRLVIVFCDRVNGCLITKLNPYKVYFIIFDRYGFQKNLNSDTFFFLASKRPRISVKTVPLQVGSRVFLQ